MQMIADKLKIIPVNPFSDAFYFINMFVYDASFIICKLRFIIAAYSNEIKTIIPVIVIP